jgi:F0F1-type ATP synthase membrane subunit b/b'
MSSLNNNLSLLNDEEIVSSEEVTPSEVVTEDTLIATEDLVSKIDIKTQLPLITSNFGLIKAHVLAGLKEYEVTVTLENMDKAKEMAKSLSALSNKIEEARKNTTKIVSAPIDVFSAQCKELTVLVDEKRQFLIRQVEVFNDITRKECLELLQSALATAYFNYGVTDEFKTAKVDDLAIVSNKTQKGITSKAKSTVEARALSCKKFQEKIDEAKVEASKVIEKAHTEAEKLSLSMKEKAKKEIELLIDQAKRNIQIEKDEVMGEIKKETVNLIMASVEKILNEKLDSEKDKKLIEESLKGLQR